MLQFSLKNKCNKRNRICTGSRRYTDAPSLEHLCSDHTALERAERQRATDDGSIRNGAGRFPLKAKPLSVPYCAISAENGARKVKRT